VTDPIGAQAAGGSESVTWWGHSTTLLEIGGERLLTDPLLRPRVGPLRWADDRPPVHLAESVSAVLLSHLHHDHCDLLSLAALPSGTTVVAPAGTARLLRNRVQARVEEMRPGDRATVGRVRIRAVHAEHDGRRARRPGAPRSPALGYVVEGAGTVFFAGDTEVHPGMADLGQAGIDLALLPVGGWGLTLKHGHMNAPQAAHALTMIRPSRAVPIHWGTLRVPVAWRLRRRMYTDPGVLFAACAAQLAPEVDVVVPPLGTRVPVPAGASPLPVQADADDDRGDTEDLQR
jgi:L-ascorbate metabolism protein UlaG (beta-lactamase superfamily)